MTNADLREAADRWPQFAPQAVAAGFRSVHAFRLRLRRDVIGALNLFGTDAGLIDPVDAAIVQALGDVATIGMLQERALRRGEVVSEQLQSALNSRIVIEQAKGVIAQIHAVSVDEAFQLLRTYSRNHNVRLGAVARAVVSDPSAVAGLTSRRTVLPSGLHSGVVALSLDIAQPPAGVATIGGLYQRAAQRDSQLPQQVQLGGDRRVVLVVGPASAPGGRGLGVHYLPLGSERCDHGPEPYVA